MGAVGLARTVIGIIGNITSFFLFTSPWPTMYRILEKKSVEEFKPDPYLAGAMNCIFWIFYGLPIVHPHSTLVVTINSIGLALQLGYLAIFFTYGDKKLRIKIMLVLLVELIVFAAIASVALLKFHAHNPRINFVGAFCVFFGIILYSSPLTIMKKVIQTKSVEFMPFWLSFAAWSNGVVWSAYAFIGGIDYYILTGNGVGALLATAQLILYVMYRKSTPRKDESKPTEVQLSNV
ncbi:hypothetical protein NMG60_11006616 [Bertholletia excelsa]